MVAKLLDLLDEEGTEHFEDGAAYDLLRVPAAPVPLRIYEAKTLEADDLTQTRLAIGQLHSYEYLNVRPGYPGRDVELAVVYERPVNEELCALLNAVGIGGYALVEDALVPLNDVAGAQI